MICLWNPATLRESLSRPRALKALIAEGWFGTQHWTEGHQSKKWNREKIPFLIILMNMFHLYSLNLSDRIQECTWQNLRKPSHFKAMYSWISLRVNLTYFLVGSQECFWRRPLARGSHFENLWWRLTFFLFAFSTVIPLLLLFCQCGSAAGMPGTFAEMPFDTKSNLINYRTEGQGENTVSPMFTFYDFYCSGTHCCGSSLLVLL